MRTGLHWLATKFRTFRKSCSTSTLPENTCLKLCRFLIVDIFETKIARCILVAILLDILSIILIQTYFFVENFDINYLLTFALSYTMMLYATVAILFLPDARNNVKSTIKKIDMRDLNTETCKSAREKIRKEIFLETANLLAHIILAVVSSVLYTMPKENMEKYECFIHVWTNYFPKWKNISVLLYRIIFFPTIYVSIINPSHLIKYSLLQIKFQVYVSIHQIEEINLGYEDRPFSRLDSQFHEMVSKRLLSCIKLHLFYYGLIREIEKRTTKYLFVFKTASILLYFGLTISYFSQKGVLPITCLISLISLSIFSGATVTRSGQELENLSDDVYMSLVNVKWYHWNESNKRNYLIFLTNAMKPFKLKYSQNVSLNYKLAIELLQAFFSAISISSNLKNVGNKTQI
ncbi:hypothetical protein Zmor_008261 [Zophobas morio]|uniref:Odorant receptor n=1 Tax=Zophobas morio TaxID=2755281 RepID=A0AA38MPK9_9CUCU|nr:hypothetical protein Zmor_008261 [Zophobas morio]